MEATSIAEGPADHDYVKIAPGNFQIAFGERRKELKTSENCWRLFNILPGRKFEFLVNSKPAHGRRWTAIRKKYGVLRSVTNHSRMP